MEENAKLFNSSDCFTYFMVQKEYVSSMPSEFYEIKFALIKLVQKKLKGLAVAHFRFENGSLGTQLKLSFVNLLQEPKLNSLDSVIVGPMFHLIFYFA